LDDEGREQISENAAPAPVPSTALERPQQPAQQQQ